MEFAGEHLLPGKIGHVFVLLSFVSSLLAAIAYLYGTLLKQPDERNSWIRLARGLFLGHSVTVFVVFAIIFYICSNHQIEYLFAYKHTSKELEFKYLLACIWEDQSGSFLLWSIWHCVMGMFIIFRANSEEKKSWEAPVMALLALVQVFLAMMIMGVELGPVKIGNSPFMLTRNEISAPIFERADYLSMIKDGVGLNVLLRNYWMVIHPPILFLGFASTLIPFGYAVGGLLTKRYGEWVKPALPWTIFSACMLGVGIMMGGKWAYESLSFGGYWAWDPVENASLVPWLIITGGLHTMLIYRATSHSLRASYTFILLTFLFVLYSTFLTRTGILGDTSVHAFTEAGSAMNILILSFLLFFTVASMVLFGVNLRKIPAIHKEEETNTREFWMFIASLVFFLSSLFISFKTSLPVINKLLHTTMAPPENLEFSYNKVMVLVAVILGILSAVTQFMRYQSTPRGTILKKIALPTFVAAIITALLAWLLPVQYYKEGAGFLAAIYAAMFASVYAVVANAVYIQTGLNGKWKSAGGSLAHLGFAVMIIGMIFSSGNKKVISEEKFKTMALPTSIDPLTKQQDNPAENINLIRQVPNKMGDFSVTYLKDSAGHETGRRFYNVLFERKNNSGITQEQFILQPDVYIMKDNNMSSNPDIKSYLSYDVFTYVSYAMNPEKNVDTTQFRISELKEGDTLFYSKGWMILDSVVKNVQVNKFGITPNGPSVKACLRVHGKDGREWLAAPMITIDSMQIKQYDDTLYAENLFVQFAGVSQDQQRIKIGVKESSQWIDFVTLKAYVFPGINLVWIGLIIMTAGFVLSTIQRSRMKKWAAAAFLLITTVSMLYMFLLAH